MAESYLTLLKDNRTLTQLCEIYYQNTGMVISFHYPGADGEKVDFYPQEERSSYCKLVQSAPEGNVRCLACDREGLAKARRKGGYHIYHCHAGLVDVAIPIDYNGAQVGSIYTGQVILEEPSAKRLRALHARLAIPRVSFEQFAEAFSTVKVVDQNRLHFYVRLLDLVANYIIKAENEIRLQRQIVLKDRQLHRRQMAQVHLEKTLKDLSISVLGGGARRSRPPSESAADGEAPGRQVVEKAQAFIETHLQPGHHAGGRGQGRVSLAELLQLPVQEGDRRELQELPGGKAAAGGAGDARRFRSPDQGSGDAGGVPGLQLLQPDLPCEWKECRPPRTGPGRGGAR